MQAAALLFHFVSAQVPHPNLLTLTAVAGLGSQLWSTHTGSHLCPIRVVINRSSVLCFHSTMEYGYQSLLIPKQDASLFFFQVVVVVSH